MQVIQAFYTVYSNLTDYRPTKFFNVRRPFPHLNVTPAKQCGLWKTAIAEIISYFLSISGYFINHLNHFFKADIKRLTAFSLLNGDICW